MTVTAVSLVCCFCFNAIRLATKSVATSVWNGLLSRTKSAGHLGNNPLLATPHGRAVDRKGSVESIEISGFSPGRDLPESLVSAIPTVNEIYALFSPDSVEILNDTIIFYLPDKTKVKYPLAGSADKLLSLQLWMNQARIRNQPAPKEIDLRFNYPVIKN